MFGAERRAAVARELTKAHETTYRGTLAELIAHAKNDTNFARGEITIVVQGAPASNATVDAQQLERAVSLLVRELPPGRAAALAAQLVGAKRSDAYALAMRLTKGDDSADDSTD
jgi:16S rRNA (cytidine1402-2'-O)-methyltransferase